MIVYNDNESFAAAWLAKLAEQGHLPQGKIDGRSIVELSAEDLDGATEVHLFAGIGGWPLALQLAGWSGPVWTGSCPCQPFSAAGKRRGTADERHLWPEFLRLVRECRPPTIFGEQVASKAGREWLAGVRADLEALGYAVGAADLCAAGAGAPHIRQRLFWVADAYGQRQDGLDALLRPAAANLSEVAGGGPTGGLDDADQERHTWALAEPESRARHETRLLGTSEPGSNFWSDAEWLPCLDGKARRVEPGTFPLAHGVPARVGRLRGYGNAIVPQVAATFVRAFMETR